MHGFQNKDFIQELQGLTGQKRKQISNGLAYRIRVGSSREEIIDYIREAKGEPKRSHINTSMVSMDNASNDLSPDFLIKEFSSPGFLDKALSLKRKYLYPVSRYCIYAVIISISLQPVEAFFSTLDLFKFSPVNSIIAALIAIFIDLVAMDLFGRSIAGFIEKRWITSIFLLAPSLFIIAANIYLTRDNLSIKSNVSFNEKQDYDYKEKHKKAEDKKSEAEIVHAEKLGKFLAVKWQGALSPDKCETKEIKCRGPYIAQAMQQQQEYLSAKTLLDSAKHDLGKIEASKPAIIDSSTSAGVHTKILVYTVLWFAIMVTYIYEPRRERSL